jgi:parallel beta-helix repeat protein
MPIVAAGNSATVSVGVNDLIEVDVAGGWLVKYQDGTTTVTFSGDRAFGPFTQAASVTLTSVYGPFNYEISNSGNTFTPANKNDLSASTGSSLVGFIQSGTGAVARTAQDKGRETVSGPDFGAVGDGIDDDTVNLQKAIDATPDYGELRLTAGKTYYITSATGLSITNRTNLHIIGNGAKFKCAKNARGFYVNNSSGIKISGCRFLGTIQVDSYVGNAEQGRIVVQNSTDVDIFGNLWQDTAAACFVQTGAQRLWFHHNAVLTTHAGTQTSSAAYKDLVITDNFFLGHVYNIADQGSDDQIAIFGTAAGRCIIARNIIDKQGPTAYNHARGISVAVGAGSAADIQVIDNIVQNVITTTVANARAAISVEATDNTHALSRISVRGNHVYNSNTPVYVGPYVTQITVTDNVVNGSTYLSGTNPQSGAGIRIDGGGSVYNFVMSNNSVMTCDKDGVSLASCSRGTLSGNIATACGGRGLVIDTCTDVSASCNTTYGNTSHGLVVNNSQRICANGNMLTNNGGYGMVAQGASVAGSIVGNTLDGNSSGAFSNAATAFDATFTSNHGAGSYGLSSTATVSNNLCGTATFASAATKSVTFTRAEADTSYRVAVGAEANETIWVTSKTTSGFTLNSSNATSTAVVDWVIVR